MAMALAGFNQPQLPDPALCHESDDDSNEDAVQGCEPKARSLTMVWSTPDRHAIGDAPPMATCMCTSYLVGHLYCMLAKPSAKQMRKLQLIQACKQEDAEPLCREAVATVRD